MHLDWICKIERSQRVKRTSYLSRNRSHSLHIIYHLYLPQIAIIIALSQFIETERLTSHKNGPYMNKKIPETKTYPNRNYGGYRNCVIFKNANHSRLENCADDAYENWSRFWWPEDCFCCISSTSIGSKPYSRMEDRKKRRLSTAKIEPEVLNCLRRTSYSPNIIYSYESCDDLI